jgi:hypothetical protein
MAEQTVIAPEDIESLVALLKGQDGPLSLDVLVEHYVARLKERVIKEAEAAPASA